MRTKQSSDDGTLSLRLFLTIALTAIGTLFTMLSFAASPSSGSISTNTAVPLAWDGTALGVPPAANGESTCVEGTNCDTFTLTVNGTQGDWSAAAKRIEVKITSQTGTDDY